MNIFGHGRADSPIRSRLSKLWACALAIALLVTVLQPVFAETPNSSPATTSSETSLSEEPDAVEPVENEESEESETETSVATGDAVAESSIGNVANQNDINSSSDGGEGVEDAEAEEEMLDGEEDASAESSQETSVDEEEGGEGAEPDDELLLEADTEETDPTTTTATLLNDSGSEEGENDVTSEEPASDCPALSDVEDGEESASAASTTADLTASVSNDGCVESESQTEATTGHNQAAGGGGNATVSSGDAQASADVVNVINTNIFDSQAFLYLLSRLGYFGNVDARALFEEMGTSTDAVSCDGLCTGTSTPLSFYNVASSSATITNDVIVRSNTGENSASGNNASVTTGDAFANANLINVANTNIVNSNYMLLVFNNFGGWSGDFVLPGKDFFSKLFGSGGGTSTPLSSASFTNDADFQTNATTTALTGGNSATSTEGAANIKTGNAGAGTTVFNQANTNFHNTDALYILFRVHGTWTGSLFGAPKEVEWTETPGGISIFGSSVGSGGIGAVSNSALETTNSASITNNVDVYALSGSNKVEGVESGSIETGNAYAGATIINIANTNVYGRNWMLAIINIFGDWDGNISFGEPNLWVGGRVEAVDGSFQPGKRVRYHVTLANRGDADATNVKLQGIFDETALIFSSGSKQVGSTLWNVGTVPAGETIDVSYDATLSEKIPYGETVYDLSLRATSREPDADMSDNSESVSFVALHDRPQYGAVIHYTPEPELRVEKRYFGDSAVEPGNGIDFEITITNEGGSAYHAVLIDTLKDQHGSLVHEQTWELGEIFPDEEIVVSYTTMFGEDAPEGPYRNYARVEAIGRHASRNPFYGYFANSNEDSITVVVLNDPYGENQEEEIESAQTAPEEDEDVLGVGGTLEGALGEGGVSATSSALVVRERQTEDDDAREDGGAAGFISGSGGGGAGTLAYASYGFSDMALYANPDAVTLSYRGEIPASATFVSESRTAAALFGMGFQDAARVIFWIFFGTLALILLAGRFRDSRTYKNAFTSF